MDRFSFRNSEFCIILLQISLVGRRKNKPGSLKDFNYTLSNVKGIYSIEIQCFLNISR